METKTKNKRAVIFSRVSSQNERQNTERQIIDLKKYGKSQSIEIVNVFQEKISGAKKIEEREILRECLSYCIDNSVDFLFLSELSSELSINLGIGIPNK